MANGERSQSRTQHGEMMSLPESRLKPDHETQLKGDGVGVAHSMGSESKQAADTTTQARAESLFAAEKRTLEMIAGSARTESHGTGAVRTTIQGFSCW
jgi:hypothetical protein